MVTRKVSKVYRTPLRARHPGLTSSTSLLADLSNLAQWVAHSTALKLWGDGGAAVVARARCRGDGARWTLGRAGTGGRSWRCPCDQRLDEGACVLGLKRDDSSVDSWIDHVCGAEQVALAFVWVV